MSTLGQILVNGLGKGAVYALLALGFVVIYRTTEVVNFAHPSLMLFGGYLAVVTHDSLGWAGAAALGVASAGMLAVLVERLLLARARHADALSLAVLTLGVDVIVSEEIFRRLGVSVPFLGEAWDVRPIQLGPITLFRTYLIALAVAAILITAFFLAFRYTNWGVAMRAWAENREAAALMGIRGSRITASAWLVAGVLGGIAVLFIATQDFSGAGLSRGTHSIALVAFPAAILGGLTSPAGGVLGGLVVGLVEALSEQYIAHDFARSAVFIVMLAVLVARPSGLFGVKEPARV